MDMGINTSDVEVRPHRDHVVSLKGNQVEVQPSIGGPMEMKLIKHVKYILPAD